MYANILETGKDKANNDVTLGCYCEFPCQINLTSKPEEFKTRFFTSHAKSLDEDEEEKKDDSID